MVICKNCGGQHPVWECRKPAKESTAALTEVRVSRDDGASSPGRLAEGEGLDATQTVPLQIAGTQALPVDTPPAPAAKPNRNAYSAAYMRNVYRPKLRAKKAALTVNTDTGVNDGR